MVNSITWKIPGPIAKQVLHHRADSLYEASADVLFGFQEISGYFGLICPKNTVPSLVFCSGVNHSAMLILEI